MWNNIRIFAKETKTEQLNTDMPTLNWIGKDKVVGLHNDVPFHVLEHGYGFTADGGKTEVETSSGNKIIHGDNLTALKSLLPEYEGRVDCIYIDPPYNTGNENWVYNDNANDPRIKRWLGEVVGKEGEDLSRHDKWCCMMYPRLRLLKDLLSEHGVIFISIDNNEIANLKLICDEIFGIGNFVTDLIWRSSDSSNHDAKQFSADYNHTLIYSKCFKWQPKLLERTADDNRHYKNPDNDPNGPWFSGNLSSPNPRANLTYDIVSPQGFVIKPPKNGWRWSKETMKSYIDNGDVVFLDGGKRILKKTYLKDQKGIVPSDIWWDIEITGHNRNAKYELKKIFPELKTSEIFSTPKPSKFIKRILDIATNKDSIILDSFAGSGTTAHAVMKKNKEDGGNRRFILIELGDYAESITAERVKRVMEGYGDIEGLGGAFDYYELGPTLFDKDGFLNEEVGEDAIREYVYYSETRQHLTRRREESSKYLLDTFGGTAYYFYYEPHSMTSLDFKSPLHIAEKADQYIIYADVCYLPDDYMRKHHIIFKKIPRDIRQF
ncbi:site-specific DNA-methyltransferase [Prevotella lacticifex]|uniref:site-specific DNA-methyltransferase (adenine-specific) n=2 Tax=Prevotella lacticifex TaxID=2854755 RepID=A0A9R1CCP1_9BACT|nr:site-specific DNA-methyltransferase [Prevotella lacticifex]GJG38080.1 site-specific DNA-methyltransferase [Prevotella lacticifex]GJG43237.1 site-specific DNA-methyltransferase [Prevotella lacticifex]GJG44437.1 site-specific DNA-methyltransferase [Prevotella lacticifex]GJG49588.1 site-specific DNA-methyltransferase [Prevotella lacticifex]